MTGSVAPRAPSPARRRRLRDLAGCRSGLALVEFAASLPVLLVLGLYGFETANLAIANLRISNMATITADNAARIRESIDEANVVELLTGSKMTGTNIDFAANGRIILTSLEATPDGTAQWIRWQRCDGALDVSSAYGGPRTQSGTIIANGTEIYASDRVTPSSEPSTHSHASARLPAIGPPGRQVSARPGTAVMVVEVIYDYQPVVGDSLFGPLQIRYEAAFNVRQRTDQRLINAGRATPKSCDTFQA